MKPSRSRLVVTFMVLVALLFPITAQHAIHAQAPGPCSEGPHSGVITSDQSWCTKDSPHQLTGDVTVSAGVTLTIEPGVEVHASPNAGLKVQGILLSVGQAGHLIIFTGVGSSTWSGLLFDGGYGTLRYVRIERASDAHEGITETGHILARNVQAGELVIEDSTLIDGLCGLDMLDSRVALRNTTFQGLGNGTRYPLYIRGASSRLVMTGNTFTGNVPNRIWLGADALSGADTTLSPQTGIDAYYLHDGYTVPAGRTLTLQPGVKIITRSSDSYTTRAITVNGHLSATGTASQPIVFTSVADSGPSQWAGIRFDGGTGNLVYVTLRNVGQMYEGGYDVALLVANTPASGWVTFDHSNLANTSEDGIRVSNGRMRISNSAIHDTSLSGDSYRNAVNVLNNSTIEITGSTFTNNMTAVTIEDSEHATITGNTFTNNHGWLGTLRADTSSVVIRGNRIENSEQDGIVLAFSGATISENIIRGSGRSGVVVTNAYATTPPIVLTNNVIIENAGLGSQYGGLRVQVSPAVLTGWHNTFARNLGCGVIVTAGTVTLTNTILAGNAIGAQGGYSLNLDYTLFDGNTTDISGSPSNNHPVGGSSAFAADGYHLTSASAALGVGTATSVAVDIDGEMRPSPAGSAPDLGADEYTQTPQIDLDTVLYAFSPQWFAIPDPGSGAPAGVLRQRYLLRLTYDDDPDPQPATATLTDTFSPSLTFDAETHTPAMNVTVQGNQVQWQTQAQLQPGNVAAAWLDTIDGSPIPGEILENSADFTAGGFTSHFETTTSVPVLPPLITFPGNGEICPTPDHSLTVTGGAQPGTEVVLYEDGVEKGRDTLPLDGNGIFEITYPNARAGESSTTLTAKACSLADPGACSATSDPVQLTASQSFWCPQRSHWTNASHFRSRGLYTTQSWGINGGVGMQGADLYLYTCNCPGTATKPTNVRVETDGVTYLPEADSAPPVYHFKVGVNHRTIAFVSDCGRSSGVRLIDPDGFVFDVTKGFDPVHPSANAVAGVTVTAYVEMPEWGGWVPWPAHLYEHQQNPQVTGANGYFAFFTPPGRYYLQVDGIPGYQPWRSPVIEVLDEIVHVNVPYTPWPGGAPAQVTLSASGPQPAAITIRQGSSVEWTAGLPATDAQLLQLTDHPLLHVLSALNPLANTLGWDSGMLAPARAYRRTFTRLGIYTYSDGTGHTGTVRVLGKTYIPVVRYRR